MKQQLSPSPELDSLTRMLRDSLSFLKRALAPVPLRKVTRAVLSILQEVLWLKVLCNYSFSTAGAAQLRSDLAAIVMVVDGIVGKGVTESGLRKVMEGVRLLSLPVQARHTAEIREENDTAMEEEQQNLGLWAVQDRMFKDHDSGIEVLEQLGLDSLSLAEARRVLSMRIELKS
jgi:RAD50-interacting protein 1